MNKFFVSIFFISCTISNLASSQDTRKYELTTADNKLNLLFKKISSKLNSSEKDRLIKAQRAWITFRDLDCKWAFQSEPLDCLIDRTVNRTNELENTSFTDINGKYGLLSN